MKGPKKFEGQDAVDELRRQLKLNEKPYLVVISRGGGGQPYRFEGYKVLSCVVVLPDDPDKHFIFSFISSDGILKERFVFGQDPDYEKNLYPLLGIEVY